MDGSLGTMPLRRFLIQKQGLPNSLIYEENPYE